MRPDIARFVKRKQCTCGRLRPVRGPPSGARQEQARRSCPWLSNGSIKACVLPTHVLGGGNQDGATDERGASVAHARLQGQGHAPCERAEPSKGGGCQLRKRRKHRSSMINAAHLLVRFACPKRWHVELSVTCADPHATVSEARRRPVHNLACVSLRHGVNSQLFHNVLALPRVLPRKVTRVVY